MAQAIAKTRPVKIKLAVKVPATVALLPDKLKRIATNLIASNNWR
jgi:hypothetical protein